MQQYFVADQTEGSPANFSIRRARLGVTGKITDRISINVIGGYAEPPNNTPRLVNAFVHFNIHPMLQIRTGQFLLPFGLEGPEPIPFNPAIERSFAVRRLNPFVMFRDVGIQFSGRSDIFNYAVAIVNGAGANLAEQADPKDVLGRIGVALANNLEIGVSGHLGQYQPDAFSNDHESRYRAGVDISYEGNPVFMRAEYMVRKDDQPVGEAMKMSGGYVLGGYELTDALEGIVRYGYFDPDNLLEDDHYTALTLGANYYFKGYTRLSINYELRNNRLNPNLGDVLTVQMQVVL